MRPALAGRHWLRSLLVLSVCAATCSCARTPSRSEVARILERHAATPAGPRVPVTVDWKAAERSGIVMVKAKRIEGFLARNFEYYVAAKDVPLLSSIELEKNRTRIATAVMERSMLGWPPEALEEKHAASPRGVAAVVPFSGGASGRSQRSPRSCCGTPPAPG